MSVSSKTWKSWLDVAIIGGAAAAVGATLIVRAFIVTPAPDERFNDAWKALVTAADAACTEQGRIGPTLPGADAPPTVTAYADAAAHYNTEYQSAVTTGHAPAAQYPVTVSPTQAGSETDWCLVATELVERTKKQAEQR